MLFAYILSSNRFSELLAFVQLVWVFICSARCQTSKMTDRLVEIQCSDLPALKKLYTPDGSKSYIGCMTIDNYTQVLAKNPEENKSIKFYCLNGDFSDGTFIVTVCTLLCLSIEISCKLFWFFFVLFSLKEGRRTYTDTLNASFDNLQRLVQLLDYSKGYFFVSIRDALGPAVLDALQKAKIEPVVPLVTLLYYLPKEEALKFTTEWVWSQQMTIVVQMNFEIRFGVLQARRCWSTATNWTERFRKSQCGMATQ